MSTEERRAPGVARVPFDGMVEVGADVGGAFEAQAVNVSEDGMQIRTAYLPELGQQVTCRFETSPGQSILACGEVVWARGPGGEQTGEFGIRFTDVDAPSVAELKRLCGVGADRPAAAQPGSKVRLYIEGLAAPMRAKIRESKATAITVGSDLGFLQVGKALELEDAESGSKRPASIHRVDVAIDPSSQVPQLVVTLRYADVPHDEPAAGRGASRAAATAEAPRERDAASDVEEASLRMKGAFARQAGSIGPALARLARRARTTVALLASRRGADDEAIPKRTTAPAPGGGLRASGRRVVRDEPSAAGADGAPEPAATGKRRAAVTAAILCSVLAGAVLLKKTHHDEPAAGPATPAATAPAPAATDAASGAAAASAPPDYPAPAAEAPSGLATGSAQSPGPASPPAAATAQSTAPGGGAAAGAADDADDEARKAAHARRPRPTPFANGPVHHGNVLRLHMDGPVESIEGAQQPAGFTVKLPGRKSLEAAAPLAARDSRIAAIKVTNEPSGAELTVTFRDGVPNYHVSARGDTLLIALAPAGALERTVAKRDDRGEVGAGAAHGKRSREDSRSPSASGAPRDEGGRAGAAALPPRGGDTTPER